MSKSKAKVKVTVKPAKKGSGTLLASVPVAVVKNENPSGKRMFQTTAQVTISAKTLRNGQPRPKHKPKKAR